MAATSSNEDMFAADLHAFRVVMKLPNDILLDSLQFLARTSLDGVQISTKHFRDLVGGKLPHVCLRFLKSATLTRPIYTSLFDRLELSIRGPPDKSILSSEEHTGKRFALLITSSFVELLSFDDLQLHDHLFGQMKVNTCRLYSSHRAVLSSRFPCRQINGNKRHGTANQAGFLRQCLLNLI